MAITKNVTLQQLEANYETGMVFVQLKKHVSDGDAVLLDQSHRISFSPDVQNIDEMFSAFDSALELNGFPALSADQWDKVRSGLDLVADARAVAFQAAELARAADAKLAAQRTEEQRQADLRQAAEAEALAATAAAQARSAERAAAEEKARQEEEMDARIKSAVAEALAAAVPTKL